MLASALNVSLGWGAKAGFGKFTLGSLRSSVQNSQASAPTLGSIGTFQFIFEPSEKRPLANSKSHECEQQATAKVETTGKRLSAKRAS
jgi:hypothetical protein